MILKNIIKISMLIVLWLINSPTYALKEDANKNLYFESDSILYQNQQNIIQYLGKVHGTQGSTEIFADKMIISYNNNHKISKILAIGQPAVYQTIFSLKNKQVVARADKIFYFPLTGIVKLINHATITHEQNMFSGDLIVIDTKKQLVSSHPLHQSLTKIVLEPFNTLKNKYQ